MSTKDPNILPDASRQAVHAARDAAQAVEIAREVQMTAAVEKAVQAREFLPADLLKVIQDEIRVSVRLTVNGKIDKMQAGLDKHNAKHEEDMKRALPVIEAYERAQQDVATATRGGKVVLWLAGSVSAIGGAYLVLRSIFNH